MSGLECSVVRVMKYVDAPSTVPTGSHVETLFKYILSSCRLTAPKVYTHSGSQTEYLNAVIYLLKSVASLHVVASLEQ